MLINVIGKVFKSIVVVSFSRQTHTPHSEEEFLRMSAWSWPMDRSFIASLSTTFLQTNIFFLIHLDLSAFPLSEYLLYTLQ